MGLTTRVMAKRGRVLHVHHYAIGFVMMTFIGYQTPILTIIHGFFNGGMIEGGVRWGFDAIWEDPCAPYIDDRIDQIVRQDK